MDEPLETAYWLALMSKDRLLPIPKIEQIFTEFGTVEPLWKEKPEFLFKTLGLSSNEVNKIMTFRETAKIGYYIRENEIIAKEGIRVIKYVDKEYPQALKNFGDYYISAPLVLLFKGSIECIGGGVAIVGTRQCSFYGHMMARKLARTIAKEGYKIISGLARGVDTEAHCGALEAGGGKTIAVLPWLDRVYPSENSKLVYDIIKRGGVLSEHYKPPRDHPSMHARAAFVIRNRIISGLSRCVILVESGLGGGTFRQATIAIKQKRKVFALKPRQDNKEAVEGFEEFVKMGATPIESAKPVLEYLKRLSMIKPKERRIDSFYENLQNKGALK